MSEDKTRTFCIYDAPSPEAIRRTASLNGLPVDQITRVRVLDPHFCAQHEEDKMFNHTLVERGLALGLAIGAASFPTAAQARIELNPLPAPSASQPAQVASAPTRAQPSSGVQSGFRWGDAGIGAAGAVVLLGAGAGTANAMRRRRGHRVVTG